jgi:mono/diheme cytochrome c family protein
MSRISRGLVLGVVAVAVAVAYNALLPTVSSQPPQDAKAAAEPAPPEGQTYTGVKQCSSCHFKQFMSWKKSKHGIKAGWDTMPEKYRTDAECVKCHTTGYGQATGFKDAASSPNLIGTTCEACHGPGSKHSEVCKAYAEKKKLSPEEDKIARDSIYKVLPNNVCAACHAVLGHKDHPKYDK